MAIPTSMAESGLLANVNADFSFLAGGELNSTEREHLVADVWARLLYVEQVGFDE